MLVTSHFDNSIYTDISCKTHPRFTVGRPRSWWWPPVPVIQISYLERTRPTLVPPPAPQGWRTYGRPCTGAGPAPDPTDAGTGRDRRDAGCPTSGISGEGVPGGGAVDSPEEVTVDPVPEEDAERQLPAPARAGG